MAVHSATPPETSSPSTRPQPFAVERLAAPGGFGDKDAEGPSDEDSDVGSDEGSDDASGDRSEEG